MDSYSSRTDGPGSALHVGREAVRGWRISIVCLSVLGIPNSAACECTIAAMRGLERRPERRSPA